MAVLGKFALTCSADLLALLDLDNIDNRYSVGYVLRVFCISRSASIRRLVRCMAVWGWGGVCVCVGGKAPRSMSVLAKALCWSESAGCLANTELEQACHELLVRTVHIHTKPFCFSSLWHHTLVAPGLIH